ncbi:MAG: hypothetical protein QOI45_2679 [Thermoleophilaceae bacterium]|jgi:ketosteroid isomerase-like protein|nr:hypothetical protein [Thermoleophilaceae bacterium]
MSQENVDRTADFIAAYNRRDFDAAVELFHPEVEWVLPALQASDSCTLHHLGPGPRGRRRQAVGRANACDARTRLSITSISASSRGA